MNRTNQNVIFIWKNRFFPSQTVFWRKIRFSREMFRLMMVKYLKRLRFLQKNEKFSFIVIVHYKITTAQSQNFFDPFKELESFPVYESQFVKFIDHRIAFAAATRWVCVAARCHRCAVPTWRQAAAAVEAVGVVQIWPPWW